MSTRRDRRLRAAVRPAQCRAGEPGRFDRLAVLPALRQPVDLRPAAGRRRPVTGRCGRRAPTTVTRRYVDRTMVLETTYRTATGTAVVVDALAMGDGNRGHALGQRRAAPPAPAGDVHRGRGRDRRSSTSPDPSTASWSRCSTWSTAGWSRPAAPMSSSCRARCRSTVDASSASGRFRLRAGEQAGLRAAPRQAGRRRDGPGVEPGRDRARGSTTRSRRGSRGRSCTRRTTVRGTTSSTTAAGCCRRCRSSPPARSAPRPPRRCPRSVGGTRNWDYRYAWVRDASFTIEALWVAACPDEANEFFDYMTRVGRRLARRRTATCRSCSASAASAT